MSAADPTLEERRANYVRHRARRQAKAAERHAQDLAMGIAMHIRVHETLPPPTQLAEFDQALEMWAERDDAYAEIDQAWRSRGGEQ